MVVDEDELEEEEVIIVVKSENSLPSRNQQFKFKTEHEISSEQCLNNGDHLMNNYHWKKDDQLIKNLNHEDHQSSDHDQLKQEDDTPLYRDDIKPEEKEFVIRRRDNNNNHNNNNNCNFDKNNNKNNCHNNSDNNNNKNYDINNNNNNNNNGSIDRTDNNNSNDNINNNNMNNNNNNNKHNIDPPIKMEKCYRTLGYKSIFYNSKWPGFNNLGLSGPPWQKLMAV